MNTLRGVDILDWAVKAFGPVAKNRDERAIRFAEEAIEVGQTEGVTKEQMLMLVERVYSRPIGDIRQEIGGAMFTLEALCANIGLNPTIECDIEFDRVQKWPLSYWQKKHAEKVKAGVADLSVQK
jgi:hypothetical protein